MDVESSNDRMLNTEEHYGLIQGASPAQPGRTEDSDYLKWNILADTSDMSNTDQNFHISCDADEGNNQDSSVNPEHSSMGESIEQKQLWDATEQPQGSDQGLMVKRKSQRPKKRVSYDEIYDLEASGLDGGGFDSFPVEIVDDSLAGDRAEDDDDDPEFQFPGSMNNSVTQGILLHPELAAPAPLENDINLDYSSHSEVEKSSPYWPVLDYESRQQQQKTEKNLPDRAASTPDCSSTKVTQGIKRSRGRPRKHEKGPVLSGRLSLSFGEGLKLIVDLAETSSQLVHVGADGKDYTPKVAMKPSDQSGIGMQLNKIVEKCAVPGPNKRLGAETSTPGSGSAPRKIKYRAGMSQEDLEEAIYSTASRPHKCRFCGIGFNHKSGMLKHQRLHTGVRPYKCTECPRTFAQHSNMKAHAISHTTDKTFCCDVCGARFKHKSTLRLHKKVHASGDGDAQQSVASDGSGPAVTVEPEAPLPGQESQEPPEASGEQYLCSICEKSFPHKTSLVLHYKTHKTSSNNYTCKYCGKVFKQSAHLRVHIRRHTRERPFKCQYCSLTFGYKNVLVAHERTHTGEKPFKCQLCGAAFTQSGNLQVHMYHHGAKQPYACHMCNATFGSRRSLDNHLKVHNNGIESAPAPNPQDPLPPGVPAEDSRSLPIYSQESTVNTNSMDTISIDATV